MGRKGASKQKSIKTRSKPFAGGTVSGIVSPVVQTVENQPAKSVDTQKISPSTKNSEKSPKNPKKVLGKG